MEISLRKMKLSFKRIPLGGFIPEMNGQRFSRLQALWHISGLSAEKVVLKQG